MGSTVSTTSNPSNNSIGDDMEVKPTIAGGATAAQVWTEPLPAAFPPGSAGAILGAVAPGADPLLSPVPGLYGPGTAGNQIGILATSGAVAPMSGMISNLSGQVSNLSGMIASYSGPISIMPTSGMVSSLSGQYIVYSGMISSLSGQNAAYSGMISSLSGQYSDYSGMISILSGQISALPTSGMVSSLSGQYNSYSGMISILSGQISALPTSGMVSSLSGMYTDYSGMISVLSGQYTAFSGMISSLSGMYNGFSGMISALSGMVSVLSGAGGAGGPTSGMVSFLSGQYTAFSGMISALSGMVSVLSGAAGTTTVAPQVISCNPDSLQLSCFYSLLPASLEQSLSGAGSYVDTSGVGAGMYWAAYNAAGGEAHWASKLKVGGLCTLQSRLLSDANVDASWFMKRTISGGTVDVHVTAGTNAGSVKFISKNGANTQTTDNVVCDMVTPHVVKATLEVAATKFYLDGVLKATHSTYPAVTTEYGTVRIGTAHASAHSMNLYEWYIWLEAIVP